MNIVNSMELPARPRITGYSYLFLSRLIEIAETIHPAKHMINRQESYLRTAIRYMEQNYHRKITIEEIARHVGLDRNYLGSLFKKHLNMPMREFLTGIRISKACGLLKREDIRIADVSRSVGYEDQLQFSKVFKKQKGMCPLDYKKSILKHPHI
jgi:YesN/AraC family two-component response regulator